MKNKSININNKVEKNNPLVEFREGSAAINSGIIYNTNTGNRKYVKIKSNADFKEEGRWKITVNLMLILNYAKTLHLHFWRTFMDSYTFVLDNIASQSEIAELRGIVSQQSLINLLTWRRSALVMMLFSTFFATIFSFLGGKIH